MILITLSLSLLSIYARPDTLNIAGCDPGDDLSCPAKHYCYKDFEKVPVLYNDTQKLSPGTGRCRCYRFYNLVDPPILSFPNGAVPKCLIDSDSGSYGISLAVLTIGAAITMVSILSAIWTVLRLKQFKALGWGPRDRVLIYMTLSAPSHLGNFVVYYLNFFDIDDGWTAHDGVRPACFALTTLFLLLSILEVAVMWLDLVKKSTSLRKDTSWLEMARKVARGWSILISMWVITFGLVLNKFALMAAGVGLSIFLLSIMVFFVGKKLVFILCPEYSDRVEAEKNGNYEIAFAINLSRQRISFLSFLTCTFLGGYTVTVKSIASGNLPFLFTMAWVGLTIPLVQLSLLAYVRFGARKVLAGRKMSSNVGRSNSTASLVVQSSVGIHMILKCVSFIGRIGNIQVKRKLIEKARRSSRRKNVVPLAEDIVELQKNRKLPNKDGPTQKISTNLDAGYKGAQSTWGSKTESFTSVETASVDSSPN